MLILEPIFSSLSLAGEPEPEYIQKREAPQITKNEHLPTHEARKIGLKNIKHYSTPSIKDALQGKFEDDQLSPKKMLEIYSKNEQKEDFTSVQLKEKWDQFVAKLDDRPHLQSTLLNVPEIGEDYLLTLEIENTVQEDQVNSVKPDLLTFLRIELKNSLIQLNTIIAENTRAKIIYTDAEKYDEMVRKNPALALLRQKLNLDFGN